MKCGIRTLLLALALVAPPAVAPAAAAEVAAAPASPLPWISDDWPRALSLARERKLPIFVENWAPW